LPKFDAALLFAFVQLHKTRSGGFDSR